jgi:hypothetical protein
MNAGRRKEREIMENMMRRGWKRILEFTGYVPSTVALV